MVQIKINISPLYLEINFLVVHLFTSFIPVNIDKVDKYIIVNVFILCAKSIVLKNVKKKNIAVITPQKLVNVFQKNSSVFLSFLYIIYHILGIN